MHNSVSELSQLELKNAKEILKFIPIYIEVGDYNGAINRSYYATFHSLKALELLDGYDSKKHSGVIAYFRQHYIKNGRFDASGTAMNDILPSMSRFNKNRSIVKERVIDKLREFFDRYWDLSVNVEVK